jgi:hypothetical protein
MAGSVEDLRFLAWLRRVAPETVKTWEETYRREQQRDSIRPGEDPIEAGKRAYREATQGPCDCDGHHGTRDGHALDCPRHLNPLRAASGPQAAQDPKTEKTGDQS